MVKDISANEDNWSIKIAAAAVTAFSGSIEPFVSISMINLSKSVDCSTLAFSTLKLTFLIGENDASMNKLPIVLG